MYDKFEKDCDDELKRLEKRLKKIYQQAYKEMSQKVTKYFESFKELDEAKRKELEDGKITKQEYQTWRLQKMSTGQHWENMKKQLAERIHDVNKTAEKYIQNETYKTYATNYNHTQYEGEMHIGISFEITNEEAVRNAVKDNHVRFRTVNLNDKVDYSYNYKKLQNELVSGIIQGKTWRELAESFQRVTNSNYVSAVRNARTSYTSAQNSGRDDGINEFYKKGIKVQKEWMSTLDERTRASHAELNGVRVNPDEKFPNGLRYPADPEGRPEEVYNCRCKLVSYFPNISKDRGTGKTVETYEQWLSKKSAESLIKIANAKDKTVTKILKEAVATGSGKLEGLDYRIKGQESLERKLKSKSKSKGITIPDYASKVTDVLRYTNVSEAKNLTEDYFKIVESLGKRGYNMIEVTNTFNVDCAYKGINTLVEDDTGYIFELQFHTPESLEIKEINHKLYEEQRLDSTSEKRKNELTIEMTKNALKITIPKGIEQIKNK